MAAVCPGKTDVWEGTKDGGVKKGCSGCRISRRLLTNQASADFIRTFNGSADFQSFEENPIGPDIQTFTFAFAQPTFISSNVVVAASDSCNVSGVGFDCTGANFLLFAPTVVAISTGAT